MIDEADSSGTVLCLKIGRVREGEMKEKELFSNCNFA